MSEARVEGAYGFEREGNIACVVKGIVQGAVVYGVVLCINVVILVGMARTIYGR